MSGRLLKIEVENFKSYSGKQTIGPFDENFVAVIGPNGSGKSNLMDALSFVLGIHSAQLRSTHLADLIYRRGAAAEGAGEDATRRQEEEEEGEEGDAAPHGRRQGAAAKAAVVSAYYVRGDGSELCFSRRVTRAGASEYRLNGAAITYAAYVKVWEGENVLIKARNFLVFQGDVEAIASKSPKDLTRLFEQISTSEELRQEYEKCREALEAATEESSLTFTRKRGLGSELKLVQEQRQDVTRFEELVEERNKLQIEYNLWRLFHLEQSARQIGALIEEREAQLAACNAAATSSLDGAWREAKRRQARRTKDLVAVERRAKKAASELAKEAPAALAIKERLRFTEERRAVIARAIEGCTAEVAKGTAEAAHIEAEMAALRETSEAFEGEARERLAAATISDDLCQEYASLRAACAEENTKEVLKLDSLERKMAPDVAVERELTAKAAEAATARAAVQEAIDSTTARGKQIATESDRLAAEVASVERDLSASMARRVKAEETQAEVGERLQSIMMQLLQAKVSQSESEREVRSRTMLDGLQRVFSGVHGRATDLCRPMGKKYDEAAGLALGRHMDAIIVDSERTALSCVAFLKEQRLGSALFIPLDVVRAPARGAVFAARGGAAGASDAVARLVAEGKVRAAIDVLKYEPIYERAFAFACEGTVICDSLDVARRLFGQGGAASLSIAKAITLDGIVLGRSGIMTGGGSSAEGGRHRRKWQAADVAALKSDRDACLSLLSEAGRTLRRTEEDARLKERLLELEERRALVAAEQAAYERKLGGAREQLNHIEEEAGRCEAQLRTIKAVLSKYDVEKSQLVRAIEGREDVLFASFCAKVAFANVREFDACRAFVNKQVGERRMQFALVMGKLSQQLAFTRQTVGDAQARIAGDLARGAAAADEELAALQRQREALQAVIEERERAAEREAALLREAKAALSAEEAALWEAKERVAASQGEVGRLAKEVALLECEVDRLLSQRKVIIRTCRIEQIDLPLVVALTRQGEAGSGRTLLTVALSEAAAGGKRGEEGGDGAAAGLVFDYSRLGAKLRTLPMLPAASGSDGASLGALMGQRDATAIASIDRKYVERIAQVQGEAERISPNLRSLDKLDTAEGRLRETMDSLEGIRGRLREAKEAFARVKEERCRLFNGAFKVISANIDAIYKELTRSDLVPNGGTAFLSLESSDEPYNEGVRFHAMPPMKRFLDMDQLSGGEKTIAALALLFAIHSYKPAPFFIMDEVDAALDGANVQRIAAFIRSRSAAAVQFLVISLKASLYERADALIGIYRDPVACSSRNLSLRLSAYPAEA